MDYNNQNGNGTDNQATFTTSSDAWNTVNGSGTAPQTDGTYGTNGAYSTDGTFTTYTGTGSTSPIIQEKKRGMGVLGAVLGALAGGVIWTIIGCLGYISGWIAVLIFVLAQAGYNKLSGTPKGADVDKFGVIISAVLGLLIIIPADYVSYSYAVYKALNEMGNFPFFEVLRDMPFYMERYELWGEFGANLAMGYLFTGIAAIYMLCASLGKKGKKKK